MATTPPLLGVLWSHGALLHPQDKVDIAVLRWQALWPQAHEPILRPTLYDFEDDAACLEENDELMLGPWLLAAPVVAPGGRSRTLHLPRGPDGWYDFYSGEYHEAGQVRGRASWTDRQAGRQRQGAGTATRPI
jgi:Glycosyl hydrolases family 31